MYERNRLSVEELPATGYAIVCGLLLVGAGFGLDRLGYYVESGIVTAIAVVVIALAVFGHALIWILGALE